MQSYFVTGTDTDVGKTYVSAILLKAASEAGKKTVGYKPVSAGCEEINGRLVNEDASQLLANSSLPVSQDEVNPIAFVPPIAPHIAAKEAGVTIDSQTITEGYDHLKDLSPDLLIMEGAGGWRLPLGDKRYLSDIVKQLQLDVIIVVGMRLGCLNHALLTAEAVQRDGLKIKGWIANQLQPDMPKYAENLSTLKQDMPAPLLGEIPYAKLPASYVLSALTQQLCE